MEEPIINKKRIRDSAPYRKTIALSELDIKRAEELERIYPSMYPSDAPFNFSKLISKAIEVAYQQALLPGSPSNKDVHESIKRAAKEAPQSVGHCQHVPGHSHNPKRNKRR